MWYAAEATGGRETQGNVRERERNKGRKPWEEKCGNPAKWLAGAGHMEKSRGKSG